MTMIFLKCKSKGHIEFDVFQALGKKLEVLYDPKVHDKDRMMAKVGDALLKKGVVRKTDENLVISRNNMEVDSGDLLDKVINELEQKKAENRGKQKKEERIKHNWTLIIRWLFYELYLTHVGSNICKPNIYILKRH